MRNFLNCVCCVGLIFVYTYTFAQEEDAVMDRYDYSSAEASVLSYMKAVQEGDLEGVVIHQWHIYKDTAGTIGSGSFKEAVEKVKSSYGENQKVDLDFLPLPDRPGKLTDFKFVSIAKCESLGSKNVRCGIALKRKSDGVILKSPGDFSLAVYQYGENGKWWVGIYF
ncbi:MAG: hypothetical protein WC628_05640 [Candidatus Omnitrophota bacterium]